MGNEPKRGRAKLEKVFSLFSSLVLAVATLAFPQAAFAATFPASSFDTNTAGTQIVVGYSTNLNTVQSRPVPGNFAITVNGSAFAGTISDVTVGLNAVTLDLTGAAITWGQTVQLSYASAKNQYIYEEGGKVNWAEDYTLQSVVNNVPSPDTTPPQQISLATNTSGNQIVLGYNENLDATSVPASSDFVVVVAGNTISPTGYSVGISGATVTLTLASPISFGQSVLLSYTQPGTSPIQDLYLNPAASFASSEVLNNVVDITSPNLTSLATSTDGLAIRLTYSEPLDVGSVPASSDFALAVDGLAYLGSLTPTVSGSRVTLALSPKLSFGQVLTLSYTKGTNPIQDLAGNDAASFSNQSVANQVLDTDAPTLTSLQSNTAGNKVILTYNRTLDTGQTLSTSDFQLSVNGANYSQANTSVAFSGSTAVELSLTGAAILHEDVVRLSYTGTSIKALSNGVSAATFSNLLVDNQVPDTSPPVMISAQSNVAGTQIIMMSSEPLDVSYPLASDAFTLKLDGVVYSTSLFTTNLRSDGVDLNLTGPAIQNGQQITIAYDNTTYKIYDLAGNFAASMPEQLIINNVPDTQVPLRQSIATNTAGTQITIRYNEDLDTTAPAASAFALTVNSQPYVGTITPSVAGDSVLLSLSTPIGFGQLVNLSYDSATANPIQDLAGNDAASFTSQVVQNNVVDTTAPSVLGISTNSDGSQITIGLSEVVVEENPAISAFAVLVDGVSRGVTAVTVFDSLARLTLGSSVAFGESVTLSYTQPVTNPIQDLAGNKLPSFAGASVVNNVPPTDAPQPIESAVSGDGLSLYWVYNRDLDPAFVPAVNEYVLKVNGSVYSNTLYSLAISGPRLTMTLTGPAIQNNDLVLLTYTGSTLRDLSGNLAAQFVDYEMPNLVPDTTPPQLYSAVTSTDGTKIIMLSTETLDVTKTLTASAFELRLDGVLYDIADISVDLKTTGVDLTLTGDPIRFGQIVTLAYSYSGETNKIFDLAGNFAATMPAQQITNLVQDANKPLIQSISTDVFGTKILLTYNENLDAASVPQADSFTLRVNGLNYTGSITPSILGRVLTLTLSPAVLSGRALDISFDQSLTTSKLQDLAGNDANNLFQAVVTNAVSDITAPAEISKVTNTSGTEVRIRYDEKLDTVSVPLASDFVLRVNGLSYPSASISVSISGEFVILTLSGTSLAFGQSITLDYTAGANPIQDLVGNDAANFYSNPVTNLVPMPAATNPQLLSKLTNQSGTEVILTYNQALNTASVPDPTEYFLRVNGTSYTNFSVSVSGVSVVLSLGGTSISFGNSVTLSYSGSSVVGLNGGLAAPTFPEQTVSNQVPDSQAPTLLALATNGTGTEILIRYDETLDGTSLPLASDYVLRINSVVYDSANYTVSISGTRVNLLLNSAISIGQQVYLDYTGTSVQDLAGNAAGAFSNRLVTNQVGDTQPPVISLDASARVPQGTTSVAQATANETVQWLEVTDEFDYFEITLATGIITASPLAELGTFDFTIRATDPAGNTSTKTISIEIYEPDYGYPRVTLSSGITLQTGTVNVATAVSNEPVTWVEAVDASGYFAIDSTTGLITANPSTPAGTYSYTITAIDADEFETDATILITFQTPSPPPSSGGGTPVSGPAVTPVVLPIATQDNPVTAAVFPGQPVVIGARVETNNALDPFHDVFVTMPGDAPKQLRLSISPALTKNQVALGFMTIEVTACDCEGVPFREFETPLSINLGKRTSDSKAMHSEDGLIWDQLPLLPSQQLTGDLKEGYFINGAGETIILTKHLSYFGLKLAQPELRLETKYQPVVESTHFVVNARGGAGLGEVSIESLTPNICQAVDAKRINTFDDGRCELVATKAGDGVYLPQTAAVFSFEVKKRYLDIRRVGARQMISFNLGEKYANTTVRVQIKRSGSNTWFTARTIALTRTGIGWTKVSSLKPGDVVKVMNPGVTYILKRFG